MDDAVLPEIPGCEIVDEDKIDWAEERDWEGGYEGDSEHRPIGLMSCCRYYLGASRCRRIFVGLVFLGRLLKIIFYT
jgi:hypothetical protein